MKNSRGINSGPSIIGRIAFLAVFLVISPLAQAVPPLWEASYNINATELDGGNGNATGGVGPSGSFGGGTENVALGFNFPFGGNTYSHILVDSDGAIRLTNSAADVADVPPTIWKSSVFGPGFANFGSGSPSPVILPFNTALAQFNSGGKTYFRAFNDTFSGFTGQRAVITWENSSMNGSSALNLTIQAQLFDDGTIIFSYQALSAIAGWNAAPQGIVIGVSNGDGPALAGSQDFSGGDTGIDLTGYQVWCKDEDPNNPVDCVQAGLGQNSAFDLDDSSIVYNPDGSSGFLVSSTIKDATGQGGSGICAVSSEDQAAAPSLWDDTFDISAIVLDGNNGNATGGAAPSGTFGGGTENVALGFNFPYGGTNYSHILVDSDGALRLTNSAADVADVPPTIWTSGVFGPGFANFGAGSPSPVILPFGTALSQFNTLGKTYFKFSNATFAGFSGNRAIITWEDSSLNGSSTKDLSFQAQLLDDGTIIFSYQVKSSVGTWDNKSPQGIVVGISNGDGTAPLGSQNFTTYDFGVDLMGYQIWCRSNDPGDELACAQSGLGANDGFDLDDRSVVFNPDGSTGYLVSSSIKDGNGNGGSSVCAEPPPPAAPVAGDDFITVTEDVNFNSVTNLIANDTDANGDALRIVQGTFATVQGGEITINNNNGRYVYRPAQDFFGNDSYDYTVIEKKTGGLSDTGTLFITVNPVNDPPIANDDSIVAAPATVFNSVEDLDANDIVVDGPAFSVVAGTFTTARGGEITIAAGGSYVYMPPLNFSGSDSVTYTVTDSLLTDTARLDIVVTTEALDTVKSVLKAVKKLLKNKAIKNHSKSKKFMKKAKSHLIKAIDFMEMADDVNAEIQITGAIADLRKVKKKKSSVNKEITRLESILPL